MNVFSVLKISSDGFSDSCATASDFSVSEL